MTFSDLEKDKALAKQLTSLPKAKEISVKEVVERTLTTEPTFKTLFWSAKVGKIVDKFTGKFIMDMNEKSEHTLDELEWHQILLETIIDASNALHRKTLRAPANIVVFPTSKVKEIITNLVSFKPNSDPNYEKEVLSVAPFTDAKYEGTLINRFSSFSSESLPEDLILVARQGEGLVYEYTGSNNGIPEVNVSIASDNHPYKVGDIEFWGFVKTLDL